MPILISSSPKIPAARSSCSTCCASAPTATIAGIRRRQHPIAHLLHVRVRVTNIGAAKITLRAFTQEALGAMLATHAALALSAANTREQFYSALASRDRIGQAEGIVMERFSIDAVQAFEMLKTLSQETNTPIRDLAEQVIDSRGP